MGLYNDDILDDWCDHSAKTHYEGGVWECRTCGFTNADKVKPSKGPFPPGFYTKRPLSKTFPDSKK